MSEIRLEDMDLETYLLYAVAWHLGYYIIETSEE